MTFGIAVTSMYRNHYTGLHSNDYCGRMRTAQGHCDAFLHFSDCDGAVMPIVVRALRLVCSYVSQHEDVTSLEMADADEPRLRAHFGLQQRPNAGVPADDQW